MTDVAEAGTGAAADVDDELLEISESATLTESAVQEDGSILMHLIRPFVGKGRGKHLYEAKMLERDASKMAGWKMFKNHEPPEDRRKRGGLPRPVQDLGGIVLESWWDGDVAAQGRFGQGAIMGRVKPTEDITALAKIHPALVEASINTTATGVQQVRRDGQMVNLVEGISDEGSVDWVTEGGAGGRIAQQILEAVFDDDSGDPDLTAMTDEQLAEYVAKRRPAVLEALAEAAAAASDGDAEDAADGGADEDAELRKLIAKYRKKGLPQGLAERAAKRKMAADASAGASAGASAQEGDTTSAEEEMAEITDEQLAEALATDAGQELVARAFTQHAHPIVRRLVEAQMEKERSEIEEAAEKRASRRLILRDLRDLADSIIAECKLPPEWKDSIRERFSIREGVVAPALDVEDDDPAEMEDGEKAKTAEDKVREAVAAEIKKQRGLYAVANPTFVAGQGAGSGSGENGEVTEADEKAHAKKLPPIVEAVFKQAGFDDPSKIFTI
jgi:hypothetical protein